MKGQLLAFTVQQSEGYISGEDGNRYKFSAAEWKHPSAPTVGQTVDFVVANGIATEVFVVEAAPSAAAGTKPSEGGLYKSSNQKIVMGVCGGLADRFGINLVVLRIVVFGSCWFMVPFVGYILLGLLLKPRETGA